MEQFYGGETRPEFETGKQIRDLQGRFKTVCYPETYLALHSWNYPFWMKHYAKYAIRKGKHIMGDAYHFFSDSEGNPIYYKTHYQANHSVCWLGDPRRSGKTTAMDLFLHRELERGAKVIIFDPQGEYPLSDYGDVKVLKLAIDDDENPLQIKPSLLTDRDWDDIVDLRRFSLGRQDNDMLRYITQASFKLGNQKKPCTVNAIEELVLSGVFGGYTDAGKPSMSLKMAPIFFERLRRSNLFDEKKGVDVRKMFKKIDCLVVDMRLSNELISLFAGHIMRQFAKFKPLAAKKNGDMDFLLQKFIIAFEEAGASEFGILNQSKPLKCLPDAKNLFLALPKFNILSAFVTQVPQAIHTNILACTSDKFIGRLDEPNALKKLAEVANISQLDLQDVLPALKVGEFLLLTKSGFMDTVSINLPKGFVPKK